MGFWEYLHQLIKTNEIIIDRPKGSTHPRYPGMVYPFDYGYLKNTRGIDGNELDVCRGSLTGNHLTAFVCTFDTRKKDIELKLLIGCTEEELNVIEHFFNSPEFGGALLVRR